MPLAKMARISILAPMDSREELMDRLHYLGAVHINDFVTDSGEDEELKTFHNPFEPETRSLRLAIAKTDFIIELLERFEQARSGLISSFLKERVHLTYEEFMEIEKEVDLETAYGELEELDIEFRRAESAISELEDELEAMRPWRALDCPLGGMGENTSVRFRLAVVNAAVLAAWGEELEPRCPHVAWKEVRREKERVYVAAMVHVEDLPEFDVLSSQYNLEQVQFNGKIGTLGEEIGLAEKELAAQGERKGGCEDRIRERLPIKPKVLALNDYLYNRLLKEEVKGKLLHTESVVAVEGWVEKSREEELREGLKWLGKNLDVDFSEPAEDEVPPTLMLNRKRVRPTENLVHLFGIPNHEETDPTPFVSPFFILFFGMCIGDVGYGVILALAFWLAIKKLDVSAQTKSFFRLFMYCGFAAIAVGIITRGYFGIEGKSLPGFLKFPGTMDILTDPIPLMLTCAALGLIHISVGVAIEMYDNMRQNSMWLGFCEQGTTLLLWLGLAVLALGAGVKVPVVKTLGLYTLAAGAAGIVLLSNISSKSIAGKFFGGLFNLYGLFAGTIGDVASYLRLYALGMATIAIGSVVNLMAGMVWGIPVLGIVAMLLILVVGHTFNLAISFLGAFVHPLRLQYVEFFGKFYEDGGEPFAPLALETRKTVIDEE